MGQAYHFVKRSTLRNSSYNRVFVVPDEPAEARRKRVLEWMKKKAVNDGKNVSVVDGVLLIDGVRMY